MASIATEATTASEQTTERERQIRKIKRCLALSQSSNPTEAETALRQAQAMMRTYRLTEADLDAQSVANELRFTKQKRMADWQRTLGSVAAKAFDCKLLMATNVQGEYLFEFVGVMPAAELAAYAYDTLLVQIKKARRGFVSDTNSKIKLLPEGFIKYKIAPRATNDFCHGWIEAVKSKIDRFAQCNGTLSLGQSRALTVISQKDSAAIDAWIAQTYGELKTKATKRASLKINASALKAGYRAGQEAHLNSGIAQDAQAAQAIRFRMLAYDLTF